MAIQHRKRLLSKLLPLPYQDNRLSVGQLSLVKIPSVISSGTLLQKMFLQCIFKKSVHHHVAETMIIDVCWIFLTENLYTFLILDTQRY